jgi:hypothetical protein
VVVAQKMQLLLAGIRWKHAALKALPTVLSRVNMTNKRSDLGVLDHAYDDGMSAGFLGLETSKACPFGGDQPGPRIAWLDGFAYGVWKGTSQINSFGRRRTTMGAGWNWLTDPTSGSQTSR